MADVQFKYRLRGHGWSEGRLQVGPASVELTASYLDDALGDLVRGALALARGATEVRLAWAEGPGEIPVGVSSPRTIAIGPRALV
jgi:hypothetical protein